MGVNQMSDYYTKAEIDAMLQGYAQLATTDLVNYYLKSETYTQQEIQNLIGQITSFEVVATLPTENIKTNVIYLLGPTGTGADKYEEYIYSNNAWVKIGETSIDLSNYVTVTQLNTALGFYTTTFDLNLLLQGKQDVLTAGTGITISSNVISADIPVLATVATSGSYNDLTDKPVIPVVPTLATVATTGDYDDLSNTPTLATVATSGDYDDLTNTPSIPTVGTGVVTLTQNGATIGTFGLNDSSDKTIEIPAGGGGGNAWYGNQAEFDALGTNIDTDTTYYISDQLDWSEIANRPNVPTKVSELTNDLNYTSRAYVDYTQKHPNEKAIMQIVNSHNVYLTQAEYDQLGTNVDPDTNYYIEGNEQTLALTFTLDGIGTVTYDVYVAPAQ